MYLVYKGMLCEPGSSVSIVSVYGLDDRAIDVRSRTQAKEFFPLVFVSRTALRSTQSPVQLVAGVFPRTLGAAGE
jgi:hypothetical protein